LNSSYIIENLDLLGSFFAIIFFLINKNKIKGSIKWIFYYLTVTFVLTSLGTLINDYKILLRLFFNNNLWLYHTACIFYAYFLFRYFSLILKSKYARILDIIFLIPFIILSIINLIYLNRTFTIYALTSIWVTIKCLSYFSQKLSIPSEENISTNQDFWIIAGLLLYFFVCFFIFITYDFMTIEFLKGNHNYFGDAHLWEIHNGILFISCFFYMKAIKCRVL